MTSESVTAGEQVVLAQCNSCYRKAKSALRTMPLSGIDDRAVWIRPPKGWFFTVQKVSEATRESDGAEVQGAIQMGLFVCDICAAMGRSQNREGSGVA